MAKKSVKLNKSQIIRKYFDENPHATAKQAVAAVAAKGTVVSPALVSAVKSSLSKQSVSDAAKKSKFSRGVTGRSSRTKIRARPRRVTAGAGKLNRSRKVSQSSKELPELLSANEVDALKTLARLYVGFS